MRSPVAILRLAHVSGVISVLAAATSPLGAPLVAERTAEGSPDLVWSSADGLVWSSADGGSGHHSPSSRVAAYDENEQGVAAAIATNISQHRRAQTAPAVSSIVKACGPGTLSIVQATYGLNCAGVTAGNHDSVLQTECNGEASCSYTIAWADSDPAGGCAKNYDVTYDCGCGEQTETVSGESAGQTLSIDCTACPQQCILQFTSDQAGKAWCAATIAGDTSRASDGAVYQCAVSFRACARAAPALSPRSLQQLIRHAVLTPPSRVSPAVVCAPRAGLLRDIYVSQHFVVVQRRGARPLARPDRLRCGRYQHRVTRPIARAQVHGS